MTEAEQSLQDRVESLLNDVHGDRIFSVEDGKVWVSGANARCKGVAEDLALTLVTHGIPCGLVHDDGVHAADFGGVQFRYGDPDALKDDRLRRWLDDALNAFQRRVAKESLAAWQAGNQYLKVVIPTKASPDLESVEVRFRGYEDPIHPPPGSPMEVVDLSPLDDEKTRNQLKAALEDHDD